MNFLLSLTLVLVVAFARPGSEDLFAPARSCDKADMKLTEIVGRMCDKEDVDSTTILALETVEGEEKDERRKGGDKERRGHEVKDMIKDFLTEEKCADQAAAVVELEALLEAARAEKETSSEREERPNPCETEVTLESMNEKLADACEGEEDAVVDTLARRERGQKDGKGDMCEFKEDLNAYWGELMVEESVNLFEFDLGVRKMKALKMFSAYYEENCQEEEDVEEDETNATGVLRRLLKMSRGGHKRMDRFGADKKERMETGAVATFKNDCTKPTPETITALFTAVQQEHETRKEEMKAEEVAEKPRGRPSRQRGGRRGRGRKRGRDLAEETEEKPVEEETEDKPVDGKRKPGKGGKDGKKPAKGGKPGKGKKERKETDAEDASAEKGSKSDKREKGEKDGEKPKGKGKGKGKGKRKDQEKTDETEDEASTEKDSKSDKREKGEKDGKKPGKKGGRRKKGPKAEKPEESTEETVTEADL